MAEHKCLNEQRINALEDRVVRNEQRLNTHSEKLDKTIIENAKNEEVVKSIHKDIKDIKDSQDEIRNVYQSIIQNLTSIITNNQNQVNKTLGDLLKEDKAIILKLIGIIALIISAILGIKELV